MSRRTKAGAVFVVAAALTAPVGLAIAQDDAGQSAEVVGASLDTWEPVNPDDISSPVVRVGDCPAYVWDFYSAVDPRSVPGTVPTPDTFLPECPTRGELDQQLAEASAMVKAAR